MSESTVPDLYTQEGWNKVISATQRRLSEMSERAENKFGEAILAVTHDPLTGEKLEEPSLASIITIFGSADDDKDDFARVVRVFAVAGNAFGSIFSSEMWFSTVICTPGEKPVKPKTRPSLDPRRQEGIALWTDHRTLGATSHIAVIATKEGKRSISSWDSGPNERGGRFGTFLPSKQPEVSDQIFAREFIRIRQLSKNLILIPFKDFN